MDKRALLAKHFLYKKEHKNKEFDLQNHIQNKKKHIDLSQKYINLKYFSCDKNSLHDRQLRHYIDLEFIPWKKQNNIVFIVTHEVTQELFLFLKRTYKEGFRIFLSSRENITLSIQRNFSYKILNSAINSLESYNKTFSAKILI